jgi:hypothetical protein
LAYIQYKQIVSHVKKYFYTGFKNVTLSHLSGSDIMEGNRVLTLALIWQMMRAYTLSLLAQVNLSCG